MTKGKSKILCIFKMSFNQLTKIYQIVVKKNKRPNYEIFMNKQFNLEKN